MKQEKLPPALARYETGLRMRRFEQLWETATPEQKRTVLPLVNQAVMGFFAGGPAASAKPLDQAILALGDDNDRTPERRWGMPLAITPAKRLFDSKTATLELMVSRLYETPEPQPTKLQLVAGEQKWALDTLPAKVTVPIPLLTADSGWVLNVVAGEGQKRVAQRIVSVSLTPQLAARVAALEKSEDPSVKQLLGILNKLAAGEPLETFYPGALVLLQAEGAAQGKPHWGARQAGQFWLTLNNAPVRLLAPAAVGSGKPLPLVLALHGAGGSENLFFDGYGDGKLVRLCEKKGWLLLTTRNGQGTAELPRLLAELEGLYPVDRKRVFLVGHSMGAAMGSQLLSRNPGVFAAAALLGGGGVLAEKEKLPKLFVAAGTSDFGRTGAERLAQAAGVACKVYPNCEHLTVVQEALSDVITFFERAS